VRKAMKWAAKLSLALAVVAALGIGANTAHAVTVNLGDLIRTSGSLTLDDKVFSNFGFAVTGNVTPTAASGINVIGTVLDATHEQLTFQGAFNGGGNGVAGTGDILISYNVATTNGAALIHDIALSFNGVVISPTAQASVTETAFSGLNVVGQVFVNTPSNLGANTINLAGGPFSSILVQKDIFFRWDATGQVTFSAINQTISQVAVPEPTSVLLLGSGLAAFGVWGMKRRKSA
jgi:PEP-CTERM motif-containing protein